MEGRDISVTEAIIAAQAVAVFRPMCVWYRTIHGINPR